MRGPKLSDERGIALAVAVLALVVIGAMVAGTFFAGRLEQRGGQNSVYAAQAFEAADAGTIATIAAWNPALNTGAVGTLTPLGTTSLGGDVSYNTSATKVSNSVFLIQSEGQRTTPAGTLLARRLIGTLARLKIVEIDLQAAVTARGTVQVGGNATVDGNDHVPAFPADWSSVCPATEEPRAGIRTDQTVEVNGTPNISGDPPLMQNDTAVTDGMFLEPFEALAADADITISAFNPLGTFPTTTGLPLRCDKSNSLNWGEPWYPAVPLTAAVCQNYFPIIYRNGNLRLQGGRGQGILLVDGDLELAGNMEFFGIVMVNGRLKTTGTGNKINGGVMARNVDLDDNYLGGTPVVDFSACAINRALTASADVTPLTSRSWAQLY